MSVNANSLTTNLLVTVFMALMVFVMPWADRKICASLGLNLNGGISKNKQAGALPRLRQGVLLAIFIIYLAAVAWLVFFSRSASSEYLVHVALFQDLTSAVQIDFGILNVIPAIFREGPAAALQHIKVISPANIAQVYMNVMLFVPMGYLLPYVFSWFRLKPLTRSLPVCFLASLAIENIQLISKRGFYDVDDLISNTLGGFIGQLLFISVAYVVTHPNWRKELKSYRR